MTKNKTKEALAKICMDVLRELYQNSTPQADFDELIQNAQRDEDGRKIIPYDDYIIEEQLMVDIVNKHIKENNLNKSDSDVIKYEVYLGPSPKTKEEKIKT